MEFVPVGRFLRSVVGYILYKRGWQLVDSCSPHFIFLLVKAFFFTFSREAVLKLQRYRNATASLRRNKGNYVAIARNCVERVSLEDRLTHEVHVLTRCLVRNCRKSLHVQDLRLSPVPSSPIWLGTIAAGARSSRHVPAINLSMTLSNKLICFDIRLNAQPRPDRWM